MNDDQLKAFQEIGEAVQDSMDQFNLMKDSFWDSLSKEDQLYAFCKVCNIIRQNDLIEGGTYRYGLYNIAGFGTEAYVPAQVNGYLAIHNAIVSNEEAEERNIWMNEALMVMKEIQSTGYPSSMWKVDKLIEDVPNWRW